MDNIELKNTKLNNYLMKPTVISNGLYLYPTTIYDYEEFRQLAMEYIVLDIKTKNNLSKQQFTKLKREGKISRKEKFKKLPFDNLFDLLIATIEQDEKIKQIQQNKVETNQMKEIYKDDLQIISFIELAESSQYQNILSNILKLLYMATKIMPIYSNEEFIFQFEENKLKINKDNFYEFREIIMTQNILFEPKTSPQIEGQKQIDRDLEARNSDSMECDIEALVALVSRKTQQDVSNYTYYRLMADFRSIMSEKSFDAMSRAFSAGNGSKGDKLPDMTSNLGLNDNPHDDKYIYKKLKNQQYESQLQQG